MISKPKPLQKLTIDKSQNPNSEDDNIDEEIIDDADIEKYILSPDISNFRDIPLGHFTVFDLTGHPITTFEGIGRFPSLQKLILKKSLIYSFKGSVEMPNLQEIDFTETPLSHRFYYREMALFALGFQIQIINNEPVTKIERNLFSLNTRQGIENFIQKGNFLISYPNSNPVSSFTVPNLGFCSSISANEISSTFTEYNETYEQKKIEQPKNIESADHIALELNRNVTAFRRARTQLSNQYKWFGLQNVHYSSHNKDIENLRLQIQGLKPTPSYVRQMEKLTAIQKGDEELIASLEDQNERLKKTSSECQKSLRLATEMNFKLQMKIKEAKNGTFNSLDSEIQKLQVEIDALKEKQESLNQVNTNIQSEIDLYDENEGKLQNDLNNVFQAAESLKKEKEASDRDLASLLLNSKEQQIQIDNYKLNLNNQTEENEKLKKQLQELNDQINDIKQKKGEIEQRIVNNRKEFDEKISKISKM